MKNEKVTFYQMMFGIVLFSFGSSAILGLSGGVAQDSWVPIILGAVVMVPLLLVYARILRLFPEKDLFEIMQIVFGKIGGKALTVLIVWYAIHLSALVLRNFSEFTQIVAMPETPQLPIMIVMILTAVYLARSSMRAIGKWALVVFFYVLFVVMFTFIASTPKLDLSDLMPFFEHSPSELAETAFGLFAFPYAESCIFLCLAGSFQKKDNPYKVFLYALAIVMSIFILVFLRNIALLGPALMSQDYFPSYVTARLIGLGDFLARIEGSISSNFLFAGIVKLTVILLAASKGLASLFNLEQYRSVVLPAGMLVLALCAIVYKSAMEMFAFLPYYPYYAFPFQVIIPLAVWISGEIYVKKHRQPDLGT